MQPRQSYTHTPIYSADAAMLCILLASAQWIKEFISLTVVEAGKECLNDAVGEEGDVNSC